MIWPISLLFRPLLGGVILNGIFGAKFPKRLAPWIGCLTMGASFAGALMILSRVNESGPFDQKLWTWMAAGALSVDVAFKFDQLSAVMLLVVTGVSLLIHIYAVGYMSHEDRRGLSRFYAYLNLFVFSMIILVTGNSYLLMFVGWEGVGLCSYLLIGFWYDREKKPEDSTWPSQAAKKAFVVNRIGDFGFLLGMFLLFSTFGTLNFDAIFRAADSAPSMTLLWGKPLLWWATILLFVGAIGKSAQIPLYVWLPDAMQGPTPVSALIHAATMVTAGVYMIARSSVLYDLAGTGEIVAWVGAITAIFAATMAIASFDFKAVLAYSTISQLGYMFVGVGVGAYAAGISHLMTHAFFKGLLFLCAGSVLHALHEVGDIRRMGGLGAKMRATFLTFLIAAFAIAGFPFLSGFFSKDAILIAAYGHNPAIFWIGAITAGLTAFYMFRLLAIAFFGQPRDAALADDARESPRVMTVPLVVLALLSAFAGIGLLGIGESGAFYQFLGRMFHAEHAAGGFINAPMLISTGLGLIGMAVGFVMYNGKSAEQLEAANPVAQLWRRKYFVDEIYDALIVRPIGWASRTVLWRLVDRWIIDGVVNLAGAGAYALGSVLRWGQTGLAQTYAAIILAGAVVILLVRVIL